MSEFNPSGVIRTIALIWHHGQYHAVDITFGLPEGITEEMVCERKIIDFRNPESR